MFVVFEGVDGTGKSTAALRFIHKYKAIDLSQETQSIKDELGKVPSFRSNPYAHYSYFKQLTFKTGEIARTTIGNFAVNDRHWLTTYIYHKTRGMSVSEEEFSSFYKAKITVLLTASRKIREERIQRRGDSSNHDLRSDFYDRAQETFISMVKGNALNLIVDTTRMNVDKVSEVVDSHVNLVLRSGPNFK